MFIHPFHLVLVALASWVNREQAAIIEYLQVENRVLRDRLQSKRLRFTDAERRRLAVKARALCRGVLREIGSLVTPDTLLRWHRRLVAKKYDGSHGKVGRLQTGDYRNRSNRKLPPGVLYIESLKTEKQPLLVCYAPHFDADLRDVPHLAERLGKTEALIVAMASGSRNTSISTG